jgi:hypothetical protein
VGVASAGRRQIACRNRGTGQVVTATVSCWMVNQRWRDGGFSLPQSSSGLCLNVVNVVQIA